MRYNGLVIATFILRVIRVGQEVTITQVYDANSLKWRMGHRHPRKYHRVQLTTSQSKQVNHL